MVVSPARTAGEAIVPRRRPGRVVIGAVVFALGILAGADIAAWFVPPA
jgi:hypothetical protein